MWLKSKAKCPCKKRQGKLWDRHRGKDHMEAEANEAPEGGRSREGFPPEPLEVEKPQTSRLAVAGRHPAAPG